MEILVKLIIFFTLFIYPTITFSKEIDFIGNYSTYPFSMEHGINLWIKEDFKVENTINEVHGVERMSYLYKIDNDFIHFAPDPSYPISESISYEGGSSPLRYAFCKIVETPKSYYALRALHCWQPFKNENDLPTILWDMELKHPKNTEFKVNNIDALLLNGEIAILKDNTNLRKGPGIEYERIPFTVKFHYCCSDTETKNFTSLPKDHKIFVIARSISKSKIEKWNNYWYYIKVYIGDKNLEGWVFGEFVKFQ
jgi:hypothetical protein